jgi:colicin import membrane protein
MDLGSTKIEQLEKELEDLKTLLREKAVEASCVNTDQVRKSFQLDPSAAKKQTPDLERGLKKAREAEQAKEEQIQKEQQQATQREILLQEEIAQAKEMIESLSRNGLANTQEHISVLEAQLQESEGESKTPETDLPELTGAQAQIKTLEDHLRKNQAVNDELNVRRDQERAAAKEIELALKKQMLFEMELADFAIKEVGKLQERLEPFKAELEMTKKSKALKGHLSQEREKAKVRCIYIPCC